MSACFRFGAVRVVARSASALVSVCPDFTSQQTISANARVQVRCRRRQCHHRYRTTVRRKLQEVPVLMIFVVYFLEIFVSDYLYVSKTTGKLFRYQLYAVMFALGDVISL